MTALFGSRTSTIGACAAAVALAALLSGAESAPAPAKPPAGPSASAAPVADGPRAVLAPAAAPHGGETRCEACHVPEGWLPARFAHERTGFPLRGQHAQAACAACHRGNDFERPLTAVCVACHVEPHQGELGTQCRGCHTEQSWKPLWAVDAHRRTAFPLVGRHASLPCEECHFEKRETGFTRATLPCIDCHRNDQARASLTNIDHIRGHLAPDCRGCHSPVSWTQGFFPEHQLCFPIRTGSHAPIRCAECHIPNALAGVVPTPGKCNAVRAFCIECHTHNPVDEAKNHRGVLGFQYTDQKCIECHRPL